MTSICNEESSDCSDSSYQYTDESGNEEEEEASGDKEVREANRPAIAPKISEDVQKKNVNKFESVNSVPEIYNKTVYQPACLSYKEGSKTNYPHSHKTDQCYRGIFYRALEGSTVDDEFYFQFKYGSKLLCPFLRCSSCVMNVSNLKQHLYKIHSISSKLFQEKLSFIPEIGGFKYVCTKKNSNSLATNEVEKKMKSSIQALQHKQISLSKPGESVKRKPTVSIETTEKKRFSPVTDKIKLAQLKEGFIYAASLKASKEWDDLVN